MADWDRDAAPPSLDGVWKELEAEARRRMPDARQRRVVDARYAGQSHELRLDVAAGADVAEALDAAHEQAYGYRMAAETVQVVTLRVVAEGEPALAASPTDWSHRGVKLPPQVEIVVDGNATNVPLLDRAALTPGQRVAGPAVITQPDTTTLLAPGDEAVVHHSATLVVRW
jgi:N-methylhydantoinase A